jgi:O-antigen ligase
MRNQAGFAARVSDVVDPSWRTLPHAKGSSALSEARSKPLILLRLVEITFVAAVFLAVSGFGGNEPLSWTISQDLIFVVAIALLFIHRKSKIQGGRLPLLALAILASWVFIQWVASCYGRIGFDSYAIKFRGLAFAAAITGFFIAFELTRERSARNRVVLSIIGLAVFESLYGLAQNPGGWQYIWAYRRVYYTGSATGTYINHNHFAGLLEMILPLALALAFYHWSKAAGSSRSHRRNSFRNLVARAGHPEMLKSFLLLFTAILIFVAIAFSLSRMGLVSAFFSVLVLTALTHATRRAGAVNWKLLFACIMLSVVAAMWIGAGPVVEHFARLSHDDPLAVDRTEGRLALWQDVAKLIRAHPLSGVGLGCFEFAFTQFQSTELTLIIDHAHNDYLELAAELGVPAAVILFALLVYTIARSTRAALRVPSHRDRAIAFGAIAGAGALLVHGAVDFNLYIPANALVFAVLLGMSYSNYAENQALLNPPKR